MNRAILLISCPDHKGITAAVTAFIAHNGGNILHADQHIDDQSNTFFMRLEWDLEGFSFSQEKIEEAFQVIAEQFQMNWNLHFSGHKSKVAVFVSRPMHCLYDILYRQQSGGLNCDISLIISNHGAAQRAAEQFGIKFFQIPITSETKKEQEKVQLDLLKEAKIDLIVLARYHQILSSNFIAQYPNQIINVHHSFLPAFIGKSPYTQAYEKGVKIIGATSHYVTEELDQGPIIEQSTARISHRDTVEDLKRKGQDLEKVVFSRAIHWHLEKKVLCYGNKTVVFD